MKLTMNKGRFVWFQSKVWLNRNLRTTISCHHQSVNSEYFPVYSLHRGFTLDIRVKKSLCESLTCALMSDVKTPRWRRRKSINLLQSLWIRLSDLICKALNHNWQQHNFMHCWLSFAVRGDSSTLPPPRLEWNSFIVLYGRGYFICFTGFRKLHGWTQISVSCVSPDWQGFKFLLKLLLNYYKKNSNDRTILYLAVKWRKKTFFLTGREAQAQGGAVICFDCQGDERKTRENWSMERPRTTNWTKQTPTERRRKVKTGSEDASGFVP